MIRFALSTLVATIIVALPALAVEPQPQAHAHNDYEHDRPLLDALDHGFCSVEADVFAIDGELRVAHDRRDTKPGRTLQKLYLNPLRERISKNGGTVYKNGPLFTLLIDFKTKGPETYALLQKVLADYRELLVAKKQNGKPPVSIVISGNRPFELIEADKDRLCGIDGRLSDLDSKMSASLMPLISDNWRNHFQWRGEGEIPANEKEKLIDRCDPKSRSRSTHSLLGDAGERKPLARVGNCGS